MKSKGVIIGLIIFLIIITIILVSVMVIAIIEKDKNYKISLFAVGNKTKTLFQKDYDIEEIKSIGIEAYSSNVKVVEGNDNNKIKLTIYGHDGEEYNVSTDQNKLEITKQSNTYFMFAFFCFTKQEVLIELPKTYNGELNINLSSGNVEITDLKNSNIQVESHSGNVTVGDSNKVNLKTTSGNIKSGNTVEGEFIATSGNIKTGSMKIGKCETKSGNIEVGDIENAELKATSGTIKAEKTNRITANTSSGSIRINNINEYCDISATSGGVRIEKCNLTENSNIFAKSGGIYIGEINDIFVNAKANSGSIKVKDTNRKAEVELSIQTTSGSIKVD